MKFLYKKNLIAFLLSFVGSVFLIYYIFRASMNVVSSDYIRIINYYISDVRNLEYLLSWEGISRIPFTFLARFINREYFHYSVFFDRILGVLGVFIFNFFIIKYILSKFKSSYVKIIMSIIITMISFSLMSWEMILNGTGYAHFLTMGFMSMIFYMVHRYLESYNENFSKNDDDKKCNRRRNILFVAICMLTIITNICFAGSYAVGFICTIVFFSVFEIFKSIVNIKIDKNKVCENIKYNDIKTNNENINNVNELIKNNANKKNNQVNIEIDNNINKKNIFKFIILILISVVCLLCYFKSNNTGEALVPVGFKDVTLSQIMMSDPTFIIRFLLKSFASAIIGVETFNYAINFNTISEKLILFIGFIYICIIIVSFIFAIMKFLQNKNKNIFDLSEYMGIFPFMFIIYGLSSFALVFLARYKFVNDSYGMTSRYAIQYVFLTIGLIIYNATIIDDIIYHKSYFDDIESDDDMKKQSENYKKLLFNEELNNAHTISKDENISKSVNESESKYEKYKNVEFVKLPKFCLKKIIQLLISICIIFIFLMGHITTTIDEIFKADYRKIIYTNLVDVAKNYENYTDDDLMNFFEYHRSAEHIKNALTILKENNLNVFYDESK